MNFTGSRQGFYEDDSSKGTVRPFSQSSSCSASPAASQQKGLVPLAYLHQHQRLGVGPCDETAFPCYSGSGGGGGANSQLDLMMNSSNSNVVDDVDESDEHHLLLSRAGGAGLDSSEGQEGGVRSSSGDGSGMLIEREHMFDKVVTPSDVGKLNRLVIPKQHAEKYFPLDSSTNEKGLLLNFEDRNGKPWRFRYSYWNSSQSYVMTKGWSRFVKEKKLDAGDIVSFQRGVGELGKDRLFIDWRRRPDAPDHHHHHYHHQLPPSIPALSLPHQFSFHHWNHPFYLQQQQQPRDHLELLQENAINSHQSHLNSSYGYGSVMTGNPCSGSIIYLRSATGGAAAAARPQHQVGVGVGMVQVQKGSSGVMRGTEEPMVFDSVPVVQGKAAAKRLRLFGVNMDCPISEEEDDTCGILSSTAVPHSTMASQPHYSSSSSISPLQLRPYNGSPLLQMMPMSSNLLNKGKASMSLNLDI